MTGIRNITEFKEMNVFLTGGTGFIGTHVIRMLRSTGINVLVLLRKKSEICVDDTNYIIGDLSNINDWKSKVKDFKPDATIHLAWEGIPDYSSEISIKNLTNSLNLISYLGDIGCKKIISTGSCWEYGNFSGKLKEDDPVKPFNAFTAAKNALNMLGTEIAKEKNMTLIWTRLFYVYGPGQRKESLIPHIINCTKKGKEPEPKTPFARNDFIHVEDVASALCQILMKSKHSKVYNIGSGHSTGIYDIITFIYKIMGYQLKPANLPCESSNQEDYWADISNIQDDVGWTPKYNIPDGLNDTIEYYSGFKKITEHK